MTSSAEEVVLVVEDDADQREAIATALASEGFRAVAVPDGRAALDVLEHDTPPRIILLDLAMPVMNGWRFLEEQRRRPRLADIPTVVVTAYDLGYAVKRGLRDVDVLPKPFTIETLLDAIRRHPRATAA